MFKLHRTRIQNMQSAAYISDTPVTLKQSHQTYDDNLDSNHHHHRQSFNYQGNHPVFSIFPRSPLCSGTCSTCRVQQVDPKHGYNNAKFERSCFINSVQEKNKVKVFKPGNVSIISPEHDVWKKIFT